MSAFRIFGIVLALVGVVAAIFPARRGATVRIVDGLRQIG